MKLNSKKRSGLLVALMMFSIASLSIPTPLGAAGPQFQLAEIEGIPQKKEIKEAPKGLGFLRKQASEAAEQKNKEEEGRQSVAPALGEPPAPGLYARLKSWIAIKQAEISRTLGDYLEKFKATNDYRFAALLIGASFLYGLVHAAGPGHGKVVVSSYVMANQQTMRRGILLAFLSAFAQASIAVGLVGALAFLFNATGSTIKQYGLLLTQASYLLIAALGAYLFISIIWRRWQTSFALARGGQVTQQIATTHEVHSKAAHDHHHHHDDNCGCNHAHMPKAADVGGVWDLAKIISLVLSVGLRPCTGALFVLAFALVKGVFWVGALAVYAMGLGTAITISAMTVAVVAGRDMALFSTAGQSRITRILTDLMMIGGALVILLFGLLLFSASLGPARPF